MSKATNATRTLDTPAAAALRELGFHLQVARKRRGWTQQRMADNLGCTVQTLTRMEHGDPTVSVGIVVQALASFGIVDRLRLVARPSADMAVQADELARLPRSIRPSRERAETADVVPDTPSGFDF